MATALTAILGNEIKVGLRPRAADRQYVGFPGAHGLVAMHMGSRGFGLVVTGKLRATGASYSIARALLVAAIEAIGQYLWLGAADYSFAGTTYYNVVFEDFRLIPNSRGKYFYFTSTGQVVCEFTCRLRGLI